MNIIIHRYNSICEPDFIDAFQSLGINVIEDRAEMERKSISVDERVKVLGELILTQQPLFVFSINFFPYIALVCEKLKCLYVCVSVDCPVVELFSKAIKSPYNRVFLFDRKQYEEVHELNPECIFHMPLGVNVSRINDTIGEPFGGSISENIVEGFEKNDGRCRYKYDVSFVGSLYAEKDPTPEIIAKLPVYEQGYAQGLIAAQSLFPGQELLEAGVDKRLIEAMKKADRNFYPADFSAINTDKFVAVNNYFSFNLSAKDRIYTLNRLAEVAQVHLFTRSDASLLRGVKVHGGVSSLVEMPKVFRESKINLNTTMRAIRTGLPQRIWDVLGCGGFLLTNYQEELPEFLEVGRHLVAYETVDEACELVQYYLSHDEEREEIARCGYEAVMQQHTVINRVSDMIRVVMNTLE